MERHPDVERLRSESIARGPIFDVVSESIRLPSGLRQDLWVVDHPGAVAIAPLLDDGRLLLVRQYRHAAGDWLLEIPAGRVEEGEDLEAAARRELEEETGHRAERWTRLTSYYPLPGFCSERMTLFLAEGVTAVPGGGLACDADEEIETVRATPAELLEGGARDAKTLLAALHLLRRAE